MDCDGHGFTGAVQDCTALGCLGELLFAHGFCADTVILPVNSLQIDQSGHKYNVACRNQPGQTCDADLDGVRILNSNSHVALPHLSGGIQNQRPAVCRLHPMRFRPACNCFFDRALGEFRLDQLFLYLEIADLLHYLRPLITNRGHSRKPRNIDDRYERCGSYDACPCAEIGNCERNTTFGATLRKDHGSTLSSAITCRKLRLDCGHSVTPNNRMQTNANG